VRATSADREAVTRLVHDEPPESAGGARCTKVSEIECQDREVALLGYGHDGPVGESDPDVGEASVDFDSAAEEDGREMRDGVLAASERTEEGTCRVARDAFADEMLDLDHNRIGNDEIARQAGDERNGEAVSGIAPIDCGDERPGVGDDSQSASTRSTRYSSARIPRSPGPSPAPT
jgi:hypothetical protein